MGCYKLRKKIGRIKKVGGEEMKKGYKVEVWRYCNCNKHDEFCDTWKEAARFLAADTNGNYFIDNIIDLKTKKEVVHHINIVSVWYDATKYRTFDEFYEACQKAFLENLYKRRDF